MATDRAELNTADPFYGPPSDLVEVPNIQTAVLGIYSDDPNDFANNWREVLERELVDAGVTFWINVYPRPSTCSTRHQSTVQGGGVVSGVERYGGLVRGAHLAI